MLRLHRFVLYIALVGGLVLGGCRTYGGYGTEPKTYQALEETVQSFESELDSARADLQALEAAAAEADTLHALADQLRSFIEEHKSLLEKQHRRIERLSAESTYRNLHSAYGATVTEQRLMTQKYQRLIRNVRATVRGVPVRTTPADRDQEYTIRPANFPRSNSRKQLTMEQALQGL